MWITEDAGYNFNTEEEAISYLTDEFEEEVRATQNPSNNEEFEKDVALIHICIDTDKEIERKVVNINYTHYHGDYAEHNTLWGL